MLLAQKTGMSDEVYRRYGCPAPYKIVASDIKSSAFRALHVVNETENTLNFVNFLEKKRYAEAGRCMLNSHSSLR